MDIEKFTKVLGRMESSYAGEVVAAVEAVKTMLAAEGKTLRELPDLLATADSSAHFVTVSFEPYGGDKEEAARDRAEKEQRREAAIKKYGSIKAVLEPDERECAIDACVAHLMRETRAGWKLGGWSLDSLDDPPPRVQKLLSHHPAPPFPTTVTQATAEAHYWDERSEERTLFGGELSLACLARDSMVRDALRDRDRLRAESIAEAALRLRHFWCNAYKGGETVLDDLDHLASREAPHVQNQRPRSATERRAEVIRLLSESPELSDREIARRVGCSPVTVWNQRRRLQQ